MTNLTNRYSRTGLVASLIAITALLIAPLVMGEYGVRIMNMALIASVSVLGLNYVLGYTGLISLAHASITGIGAYVVAMLTTTSGFGVWPAIVAGVIAAGAFSYVIGLLLLRLKGHYFALATLGVNVSLIVVASNWVDVTGGTNGISSIPGITLFGYSLDGEMRFYYFTLAVVALLSLLAYYIRISHLGRAMISVRDDELAASMSGISVSRIKVTALTIGGCYAGLAGGLLATHIHFISPEDFGFPVSITYLAMLIVGGEARIAGVLLGSFAVSMLPELLRDVGEYYLLIFGLLVLAVMIVLPKGIIDIPSIIKNSVLKRSAKAGRASNANSES